MKDLAHHGIKDGSTAAATPKIEHFVIIFNGFQPLTIITKRSILDVAVVLDPLFGISLYNTACLFVR